MDCRCIKCGGEDYEIKKVYLPEKTQSLVGIEMGWYYYKICGDCGFVEIYSAKILAKNDDFIIDTQKTVV